VGQGEANKNWSWGELFFGNQGSRQKSGKDERPDLLGQTLYPFGRPSKSSGGSSSGSGHSRGVRGLTAPIDGGPPGLGGLFGGAAEGAKDTVKDTARNLRNPPARQPRPGWHEPEPPRVSTPPADIPRSSEGQVWGRVEKQRAGRIGERVVSFFERRREEKAAREVPPPSPPREKTLTEKTMDYQREHGLF
jgi:hypothetical protein